MEEILTTFFTGLGRAPKVPCNDDTSPPSFGRGEEELGLISK
jgi:hypothetical protein